ncbi:MAG: hypothetical protein QM756_24900 [Polyangiaceae bacterium]
MPARGSLRTTLPVLGCLALSFISAGAYAQSSGDKAAAEALFDRGVALLRKKEYKEACEKLETSQKIDPAVGTLLYLGECYERLGRNASAWAVFREASSFAQSNGQADRAKIASQRADRLEADLPYLSVSVPGEASVPGLTLRRGNDVVKPELYGVSIPTDPGEITIEASAPGYLSYSEHVTLVARERRQLTLPKLKPDPAAQKPEPKPVEPLPKTPKLAPTDGRPPSVEPVRYVKEPSPLAFVLGGVGLIGIGVGSYFGVKALQKNNQAKQDYGCSGSTCTDARGIGVSDDAVKNARICDIAMGAGGALLVSGVIVYLAAPSRPESALVVAPGASATGGSLWVKGAF